jgi:two-component system, NtrC family, nitrogen regulation response regulator GlnG
MSPALARALLGERDALDTPPPEAPANDGGSGALPPLSQVIAHYVKRYVQELGHDIEASTDLYDRFLQELERPLLQEILASTNHNQVRAAAILGINRNTLRKKLAQLG